MLQPAVMMGVVVVVIMMVIMIMVMVVIVIMIVPVAFEEFRLDIEDAVEIEGVAAEHFVQRDLARARSCAAWRKD